MIRLPFFLLLLLAGCAQHSYQSDYKSRPIALGKPCPQLLGEMQSRIAKAGTQDAGAYPLDSYPYLRVNRFLASFYDELPGEAEREAWYRRLLRLGAESRAVALDNLPHPFALAERRRIEACIMELADKDRAEPGFFDRLKSEANVPSGYNTTLRALGLFPLTRLVVLNQIAEWNATWGPRFNDPAAFEGPVLFYPPASPPTALSSAEVGRWLAQARDADTLGIPELAGPFLGKLIAHHAPVWQVQRHSPADYIGALYWGADGLPHIDPLEPVVYHKVSYTRFAGKILLQLSYAIWFEKRPAKGSLDIYAGQLDGLIWRVTLDDEGRVLAYDSIHSCGCYHRLFPVSPRIALRPQPPEEENPLVSSGAPPREGGRVVINVIGGRHYLVGLAQQAMPTGDFQEGYQLRPYQSLLHLPAPGGSRSLFGPQGRVAASARPERFILWPMGVPSAGAMRQWGHHLISFTGKRHFDDPFLLNEFLRPLTDPNQ